jgi:riboflavin synthase
MFTGLVEDLGQITESASAPAGGRRLVIETALPLPEISLGDSVAVDGVCLTVVAKGQKSFSFDVSAESVTRSTVGERKRGDRVHLERALRMGDRLGGHMVQGHVDAVGSIERLSPLGEAVRVEFACPPEVGRYLIEKGSIAVDGVSLTVNEVFAERGFSVVLVPHTLEKTTLAQKGAGGKVNLEIDLIAKYVERLLPQRKAGIDLPFLRAHGFAPEEGGS